MSKSKQQPQKFLSAKCFRDSTGAVFIRVIGSLTDPIIDITLSDPLSSKTSFVKTVTRLKTGYSVVEARVLTTSTRMAYTVTFQSGDTTRGGISVPLTSQQLPVTADTLIQSFSVAEDRSSLTFSFSDTLSYPEGTRQVQSVVYPSSKDEQLDTSSKKDFYYISDGSLAYIASNDAQNNFLTGLGYTVKGVSNSALGKFPSSSMGQALQFAVTSVVNTSGAFGVVGPVVYGDLITLNMPAINPDGAGGADLKVCTTFGSQNYYLNGCTDLTLPCVDNGETHSNDCEGSALTAEIINNASAFSNGGCCTPCDTPFVSISDIENATADTADGSALLTFVNDVEGDTTLEAYTITGTPADPLVSFSTISVGEQTVDFPYSITYSTFPMGNYEINIGTGGCSARYGFRIGERKDSIGERSFGCTDATAINYDNTVGLTGFPELCVFCDAVTGNLTSGGVNDFEHSFPQVLPSVTVTNATSTVAGVSNNDGIIQFAGTTAEWSLWNADPYGIWNLYEDDDGSPNYFEFSLADNLSSSQALPFVHKLYKLDVDYTTTLAPLVAAALAGGTSTKDVITANATLIATQTGNGNQEHTFSTLDDGEYVVVTQYQTDGALDGSAELEQCYTILGDTGPVVVKRKGCTDPDALNYNSDAEIDDGSCNYERPENPPGCGELKLRLVRACHYEGQPGHAFYIPPDGVENDKNGLFIPYAFDMWMPDFLAWKEANDSTWTQGLLEGSPGEYGLILTPHAWILQEVFCIDSTDTLVNWNNYAEQTGSDHAYALTSYYPYNYIDGEGSPFSFQFDSGGALTPTNSNGEPNPDVAHVLDYWIVNFAVTYSDGSVLNFERPLAAFVDPANSIVDSHGENSFIHETANHCPSDVYPVSYNYNYNWGTYFVWEYNYQSEELYFDNDFDPASCCPVDTSLVEECTDPEALNYCCPPGTEGVTSNNELCVYPEDEERPGCTDPTALNFDPLATIDDGSCEYPEETTPGAWVCKDAAVGICEFVIGLDPALGEGYETQAECQEQCLDQEPDDCLELSNWVNANSGGMTATSTSNTSVLNETTGLCDPDNNGTVTINIPNSSDLTIDNPHGVIFQVTLWNNDGIGGIYYNNYYEDGTAFFTDAVPVPGPGDYLSLTSYSGGTFTFTNVLPGCYGYAIKFWSDSIPHTGTEQLVPSNPTQYCEGYNGTICVDINDCEGGDCVYGCMDPEADNYNPDATCQDVCTYPCDPCEGECLCPDGTYDEACCPDDPVCGCMDPSANNFNPAANIQDASCPCEYDIVGCSGEDCPDDNTSEIIPACIPGDANSILNYNNNCITTSGHRFYNKLITGLSDDCSIMEAWKMIMIQEILERKGLPCIYNCTDNGTPDAADAANDCNQKWIDGGSLYWNPTDATSFSLGTVVKRANGGLGGVIYIAVSNSGLNIDPFSTETTSITSGWKKCVNLNTPTDTEDYLQKFVSFARSYCRDCGIPPYTQETEASVEVTSNFTVGGLSVSNNGVSYTNGTSDGTSDSSSSSSGGASNY